MHMRYHIYFRLLVFHTMLIFLFSGCVGTLKTTPPTDSKPTPTKTETKKESPKQTISKKEESTKKKSTKKSKPVKTKEQIAKEKREKNQRFLENLKTSSSPLVNALPHNVPHNITWNNLEKMVTKAAKKQKTSAKELKKTEKLINFFKNRSKEVKTIYDHPFKWKGTSWPETASFLKVDDGLVPRELASMWQHCTARLGQKHKKDKFWLESGWQSPAFQLFQLLKTGQPLKKALKNNPAPYHSYHQLPMPDITVRYLSGKPSVGWKRFDQSCKEYGFVGRSNNKQNKYREYRFVGIPQLYKKVLKSKRLPNTLSKEFMQALEKTGFYPSASGTSYILAISEKESSYQWNPRVNRTKKKELRTKYQQYLTKVDEGIGGLLTRFLFSDELKERKKKLSDHLMRVTDPNNQKIREYDIFLWSREALAFFQDFLNENKNSTRIGSLFVDFEAMEQRLRNEPKTFGLWQSNVNNLLEMLEKDPMAKQNYPELYTGKKPDRLKLVKALSGFSKTMSHVKTLSLLLDKSIRPKYYDHLLGTGNDLNYFAAENLSGDMSTFRAAIQKKLNVKLNKNLVVDGDLVIFKKYSTDINWEEQSNTQEVMMEFIDKNKKALNISDDEQSQRLIKELCEAKSRKALFRSKLYIDIMKEDLGQRIYPKIKSELYNQSPEQYAEKVKKIASSYQ